MTDDPLTAGHDAMNKALRTAAGLQPPDPPAEPPAEQTVTDDEVSRLRALRDELRPAGGEALAAAERSLDAAVAARKEASMRSAIDEACAAAGIAPAYREDVARLLDEGSLSFNQDGQPHATSIRAGVDAVVRRVPALAGEPPPASPASSFDGGVRGPAVPERRGANAAANAWLRHLSKEFRP